MLIVPLLSLPEPLLRVVDELLFTLLLPDETAGLLYVVVLPVSDAGLFPDAWLLPDTVAFWRVTVFLVTELPSDFEAVVLRE